jgi:hypothetical protein
LRGNDVPHSPVAYAYLIVELDLATLFIDNLKITTKVMAHLTSSNVVVKPYGTLLSQITRLADNGTKLQSLWILERDYFSSLTELPMNIGCLKLEALPNSVEKHSSLTLLNLSFCESLVKELEN